MDLAKLSINDLMEKARRYEEIKALHAKRMMTYRKKKPRRICRPSKSFSKKSLLAQKRLRNQ